MAWRPATGSLSTANIGCSLVRASNPAKRL
jgi:hypothetical protein